MRRIESRRTSIVRDGAGPIEHIDDILPILRVDVNVASGIVILLLVRDAVVVRARIDALIRLQRIRPLLGVVEARRHGGGAGRGV